MIIHPVKFAGNLRAALAGFAGLGITPTALNDQYELYVYSLLIKAARAQPGTIVTLVSDAGNPAPRLVTKTTPRLLTESGYTHYRIEFPYRRPLEAHVGIYVRGLSNEKHECDIALIDEADAKHCRAAFAAAPPVVVNPDVSGLVAFIECKCYVTPKARLSINHGRAFLGLLQELGAARTRGFFVTTKRLTSIENLLVAHDTYHAHSILARGSHLLRQFEWQLEEIFRAYCS